MPAQIASISLKDTTEISQWWPCLGSLEIGMIEKKKSNFYKNVSVKNVYAV